MENRPHLQPLLMLLVLLGTRGTDGSPITCEATTTIYETSVTCHFGGIDISKTSHNLNVQFYYPDLKADPEIVLMCNWKTASDTVCKQTDVISFSSITDRVTLKRPQSINMVRGKYVCQLVPAMEGVPSEPCDLTFKEVPITTPKPPTTTPTTQSPMLGEIRDTMMKSYTVSCVALVVSLIILTVFIIYVFKDKILDKIGGLRKSKQERKKARDGGLQSPADVEMADRQENERFIPPEQPVQRVPPLKNAQVGLEIGSDDGHPTDSKKKEKTGFRLFGSGKKKDRSPEYKRKDSPAEEAAAPAIQNPPPRTEVARLPTQPIEVTGNQGEKVETKAEKKQREKKEKAQREKEGKERKK